MAGTGRELNDEVLAKAIQEFCSKNKGIEASEGEQDGRKRWLLSPGDIIVQCKDGRLECATSGVKMDLAKIIMDMWESGETEPAKPEPMRSLERPRKAEPKRIDSTVLRNAKDRSQVEPLAIRDLQVQELTLQDIRDYICPEATEQEAFMFLKLCQARNLNPFTKEAYLVKFQGKANMIVGKEAFTRKAELNPAFDGFDAGIIVKLKDGTFTDLPGTFYDDEDTLVGGWAEVYRKDRKESFIAKVRLSDYRKQSSGGKTPWDTMPVVMIRKVALVSALREAFPSDLSGMYDQAEMAHTIDVDFEVRG